MPIPKTRSELVEQLESSFGKLEFELDRLNAKDGRLLCVDDWTVKDLLAVRAWWTENTTAWIEQGIRGETFELPAPGYKWTETPRLNADIIREAWRDSVPKLVARIRNAYESTRGIVDTLSDKELLEVGVYNWAGKWPISRWISINHVRQYTTARTHLRRTLKQNGAN